MTSLGRSAVLMLSTALAACGSTATTTGTPGTPAPAVQGSQTATTTGSADLKAAADQYAALSATIKTQSDALNAKITADQQRNDLHAVTADLSQGAQQYQAALVSLEQIPFPASMQTDVKDLIKAVSALIQALTAASLATSVSELNADLPGLTTAAGTLRGAVNVVRADLGLPPAG